MASHNRQLGPSQELAAFSATVTFADLPSSVIEDTERSVVDWLGSALAGALEPPAQMARTVVAGLGTSSESSLFPSGRASAAAAALANGVASHILELDDIHKGSTIHGAAPIIPAALAVAEREHASGRDFLRAVALGYEAALRVGEAVNPSHYRFWHPTGTAATFGAAVAAGSLLRLSESAMSDALGSAGTQAAGLWEFNADGAMSKHLHPGKAAFNGVIAADLARVGFTGATRILEGERGFFRAMAAESDATRITDGLGSRWKVSENGYKLHACCGHTHSAIDAVLDIRDELGIHGTEGIASVEAVIYGPGFAIVSETNPRTPYQAKFSLAYVVAAALCEGRVGLSQFGEERFGPDGVREPAIGSLLSRIRVGVDPALTAKYPAAWPARVTVTTTDGRTLVRGGDYPRGNPENPVSRAVLEEKAVELIAPGYGLDRAKRIVGSVGALTQQGDVASWLPALLAD